MICDRCQQEQQYKGYIIDEIISLNPYTVLRKKLYYCDRCKKFIETRRKKQYYCDRNREFLDVN